MANDKLVLKERFNKVLILMILIHKIMIIIRFYLDQIENYKPEN